MNSIRWRLQIWHGLLLLAVLTGLGAAAYRLRHADEWQRLDAELSARMRDLHTAVERNGPPNRPPPEFGPPEPPDSGPPPPDFHLPETLGRLFVGPRAGEGFYYRIWKRDGQPLAESRNAAPNIPLPKRGPASAERRSRDGDREMVSFTPPGECLLVGVSELPSQTAMTHFAVWLVSAESAALVAALAIGAWLTGRALRPINDISATAARIAAGRLNERIPIQPGGSELAALARVLNDSFARLEAAFAEQTRFTSDAAHELRTPVSIILAQTQLALSRSRSAAEYHDTIETVRRSALRMGVLIESLLSLAKVDSKSAGLHNEHVDLSAIVAEQVDAVRALADEDRIELQFDLKEAPCHADPSALAQIVTNLLSNAVKYGGDGSAVKIRSWLSDGLAQLAVEDSGPGIAPEDQAHLFERFYRADASRNRATGGAGLGLAIARTLAEAHGGTLEVESTVGRGSTFTLRLPAAAKVAKGSPFATLSTPVTAPG